MDLHIEDIYISFLLLLLHIQFYILLTYTFQFLVYFNHRYNPWQNKTSWIAVQLYVMQILNALGTKQAVHVQAKIINIFKEMTTKASLRPQSYCP